MMRNLKNTPFGAPALKDEVDIYTQINHIACSEELKIALKNDTMASDFILFCITNFPNNEKLIQRAFQKKEETAKIVKQIVK